MGKFSQKMMGKEVGSAEVYAEPHTMKGGPVNVKESISRKPDPNTLKATDIGCGTPAMRVSTGDPAREDVKTSGIKTRGNGCATRGVTARGPMG
jgi:hypothetical protein